LEILKISEVSDSDFLEREEFRIVLEGDCGYNIYKEKE